MIWGAPFKSLRELPDYIVRYQTPFPWTFPYFCITSENVDKQVTLKMF